MVFSSCFIFTTLKCKLLENKAKVTDFMLANYPIFWLITPFYICKMKGAHQYSYEVPSNSMLF